ncbi:MAG: tetratricopeptide repeat protein [Elusimicrobiota bacterium]|nr:tetratricopeptide repeat protein [Elusimicrobiota bacterium]
MSKAAAYLYFSFFLFTAVNVPALSAGYPEGRLAYEKRDYRKAFSEFKPDAERGTALSQTMLGLLYQEGLGVKKNCGEALRWMKSASLKGEQKDDKQAMEWYLRAAGTGDTEAMFMLGLKYGAGEGAPQDNDKSFKWYSRAAWFGHGDAAGMLGMMFGRGVGGVKKDPVLSYAWLKIAGRYNSTSATKGELPDVKKKLAPPQLDAAEKKAAEMLKTIEANIKRRAE